jgi:hypothetical protein
LCDFFEFYATFLVGLPGWLSSKYKILWWAEYGN